MSTSFQERVRDWLLACFGPVIAADKVERNHRFLEEALELVQACGTTREECRQLVDYVYSRPTGDPKQEVGGVMTTLAAHCCAHGLNMQEAAEMELQRVWNKIDAIRGKQATKPKDSPLPEASRTALVCPACGSGDTDRGNPRTRSGIRQCFKCGHHWVHFALTRRRPMAEHTQGRLKVDQFHGRIYLDTEDTEESNGLHIADVEGDDLISPEVAMANARRLAACWNACQEWDTEVLEDCKVAFLKAKDSPSAKEKP